MKDAANALRWSVNEMECRYKLMSAPRRVIWLGGNEKNRRGFRMGRLIPTCTGSRATVWMFQHPVLENLPYIVVLVDEFADLMMRPSVKVEELIARLAQKARAAGFITPVLATQRPWSVRCGLLVEFKAVTFQPASLLLVFQQDS
ncbi:hypothetical protein KCP69_19600 [Salmonella enterica subsp. enterica]|nr:hypothetical protein KCP69_19600 [Salmonella enterica subsp. enterica]